MSYSISLVYVRGENLSERIFNAFHESGQEENQRANVTWTETTTAINYQVAAIQTLITQTLPDTWEDLHVMIGGHCEPTSGQRDGWSPDHRIMSVSIKSHKLPQPLTDEQALAHIQTLS